MSAGASEKIRCDACPVMCYIADGKAGAYAIQGLGAVLIDRIEGNYQGVVGLSLRAIDLMVTGLGHPLSTLITEQQVTR